MIDIVTNNVRQIGTPREERRVYISENAYKRVKESGLLGIRVNVLMGHTESSGGRYASFIEAAIPVQGIEFEKGLPMWTNSVWSDVYGIIKSQYEEMVIIGWAMDVCGSLMQPTENMESIHREFFGGAHQLLYLVNRDEQEEMVFVNRGGRLNRLAGFFIYYKMRKMDLERDNDLHIKMHRVDRNENRQAEEEKSTIENIEYRKNHEDNKIEVDIPVEMTANRGKYRELMETKSADKEKGGWFSVVLVAAVAAVVVLIGIEFKSQIKESLGDNAVPAVEMNADEPENSEFIPVEKISGE